MYTQYPTIIICHIVRLLYSHIILASDPQEKTSHSSAPIQQTHIGMTMIWLKVDFINRYHLLTRILSAAVLTAGYSFSRHHRASNNHHPVTIAAPLRANGCYALVLGSYLRANNKKATHTAKVNRRNGMK